MKFLLSVLLFSLYSISFAQVGNKSTLQLNQIMKGKDFIGYWPENIAWHADGSKILFDWNPNNELEMSRYQYDLKTKKIDKINKNEAASQLEFDPSQSKYKTHYFAFNGHLWRFDKATKKYTELISTESQIFNIQRLNTEHRIAFQQGLNLYLYDANLGTIHQLTFFQKGKGNPNPKAKDYLGNQQEQLFKYIQEEKEKSTYRKNERLESKNRFLDDKQIDFLVLSKDEKYIYAGFGIYPENKPTEVTHFVTSSGYNKSNLARPKVGETEPVHSFALIDQSNDSLIQLNFDHLSNIRKKPNYLSEYGENKDAYAENRKLYFHSPILSADGKVVMDIRSYDNKDRWIVGIDPIQHNFFEIDTQHDEAWIGGPGISSWNQEVGILDFFDNDTKIYYQSEESGFSHLYTYDFKTKQKNQLTSGQFEIYDAQLSKDGKLFYVSCNKEHPGNREFYRLDPTTKKMSPQLNSSGAYDVKISPNGQQLAYLYSDKTNPWELYFGDNILTKKAIQLTHSQTEKYKKYNWTSPKVITFKGVDSVQVYSRLYSAETTKNQPAVIFVHGAGYLQNAHNYWSNYYREFMFHNLLRDNGITVLDIDYRASEGYGRDYRTAIYRHMGGMDLEDQISGKQFLIDSLGIQPNKVGIYGGSYGGFITLMALLTKPNEFACGAALRSVTDWMHYNHEYTSNILNYPTTDSIAYYRSSPINFADGLTKPLLMLHGMVDDNVQFQDIVRLSERFIELEKTNWELAVFPVEAHGFVKYYSWIDEYRRIFDLFNKELIEK